MKSLGQFELRKILQQILYPVIKCWRGTGSSPARHREDENKVRGVTLVNHKSYCIATAKRTVQYW